MEALKAFGISSCTVLIIASLMSMIVPNISQKNVIRILISAFILSGILYSLSDFITNEDLTISSAFSSEINSEEYEEIVYPNNILNNLEECAVNALYPIINDELKKYDIEQFGVTISLKSEKNGISIKCVNITLHEPNINYIDSISQEIEDELGLEVNVNVINLEGS